MNLLDSFVNMSRSAGGRFDLIQASGGNSSVKIDAETMLIKASGNSMSEMTLASGYATVGLDPLRTLLLDTQLPSLERRERDREATQRLYATAKDNARPSIETLMHSMLGTYVLHTHPLSVIVAACRPDWRSMLSRIWPKALLVEYQTPGLDLALAVRRVRTEAGMNGEGIEVFFLQNHGLIVSGEDAGELLRITNEISLAAEKVVGLDLALYRQAGKLADMFDSEGLGPSICWACRDQDIAELAQSRPEWLFAPPLCPDQLVYNGPTALALEDSDDPAPLRDYVQRYGGRPNVLLRGGSVFLVAPNVRKAQEMEIVLRFHLLAAERLNGEGLSLCIEELAYLGDYEPERYRRKL